ncbi:AN1-type zinc finger [Fusarium mundagurra]|uniref:AN1-type zinc finger n=1 Tax=Fusarium mundagurra TaxID=1567541 RepID=A0A8H5Y2M6_9HYPO|nr:AN1-type zinc finger [Fusarium mundagurra]
MPPKRIRCTAASCREPAQRIVGDCTFCQGHFCGKHRLLEDHKCTGLEDCKKQSHERNAAQLESERTQVIREWSEDPLSWLDYVLLEPGLECDFRESPAPCLVLPAYLRYRIGPMTDLVSVCQDRAYDSAA